LADGDWKNVLEAIDPARRRPLVIVISRLADNHLWSEALNLGAYDVLIKPLDEAEVVRVLTSAWIRQLIEQMDTTHKAFKEATAGYEEMKAKYGDMLDRPEGVSALHQAAKYEALASEKYNQAVQAYSAFVRRNRLETEIRVLGAGY